MEDAIYNNFNATRCNVCFSRATEHRLTLVGTKLRYCKGCRLIGYCGEQHQKEDWKHHKDFCRAVTKILTMKKIDHILDVRTECPRIIGGTRRDLECAISLGECLIISCLQRSLKQHEFMLLRFPNICRVCFDYDTTKLKACESCHQVLYCSEEHRLQDVDRHGRWCALYRVNLLLDADFPARLDTIGFPKLSPAQLHEFPRDSFELVNQAYNTNIPMVPEAVKDFNDLKFVSNYSHVGTILYALNVTNMHLELLQSLVIYVVGVEDEISFFDYNSCSVIFSYVPQIREVIIQFIGPEVGSIKDEIELNYEGTRSIKMHYHKALFHCLEPTVPMDRPQIIVSYNCGFHEHIDSQRDTWSNTLARLIRFVNIPIVFTSYTREEACQDCAIIYSISKRAAKQRELVFVKRAANNPFKDYKPLRNVTITDESDELYYSNGYVSIVISRIP
uniref:MYND-type domain-containing protein n=1 Tax=Culex tarsalis TaxID=7177 RepID=A0A1Q3EWX6_CULTA